MSTGESPIRVDSISEVDLDLHHGSLRPAVGTSSFQVLRANREHPELAEGIGWTYNHAPMLAYRRGKFYLQYLSTPVSEHTPPGHTLLTTSPDGRTWKNPRVIFPEYEIPAGEYRGEENHLVAPGAKAVMHQRMGFYTAPNGKFLTCGFYGICPRPDLVPFDTRGIGRVVREIHDDDSLGPIYFIHYNSHAGWTADNTLYPYYTESDDQELVDACNTLLDEFLVVQQWLEEHGDADELIPLKGSYKALSWYTLPDGRTAGLWKWSKAGISSDRGATWDWVGEAPTIETAGGKVWGQKTSDGRYAMVYNPSTNNKHRWPLALTESDDGLSYGDLLLANGEAPPRRYMGAFKDFGSNYVRGITEENGNPPDGDLWVTYSVNKEDIWITRIPVPVTSRAGTPISDSFGEAGSDDLLDSWNIYSPLWAPVELTSHLDTRERCLELRDKDPYDYACAERVFPEAKKVSLELSVMAGQSDHGQLYIEIQNSKGKAPVQCVFDEDGKIKLHHGRRTDIVGDYESEKWYELIFDIDAEAHRFSLSIDGEATGSGQNYQGQPSAGASWFFRHPVKSVERLILRTGPPRREPTLENEVEGGSDLPNPGSAVREAAFYLRRVKST